MKNNKTPYYSLLTSLCLAGISSAAVILDLKTATNAQNSHEFAPLLDPVEGRSVVTTMTAYVVGATESLIGVSGIGIGAYDSAAGAFTNELGTHGTEGAAFDKYEYLDFTFDRNIVISAVTLYSSWGHAASENADWGVQLGTGLGASFTSTATAFGNTTQTANYDISSISADHAGFNTSTNGILVKTGQTLRIGGGIASNTSDVPLVSLTIAVPEPSAALLGGLGTLALVLRRRRRA